MNSNSKLLVLVLVLQGVILLGQWLGSPSILPVAQAQVPDAGAQRLQMIDELKSLNAKMDQLVGILQNGQVQVRVVTPDDTKAPARNR